MFLAFRMIWRDRTLYLYGTSFNFTVGSGMDRLMSLGMELLILSHDLVFFLGVRERIIDAIDKCNG